MEGAENCKVLDFIKLPPFYAPAVYDKKWVEKCVRDENGIDVRSFDPESQFLSSNTLIDGSFEDDKYWRHNLDNISKWLAVEPLNIPNDAIVVGFRGGEYTSNPDLFLPVDYFREAMTYIGQTSFVTQYQVHTDDPYSAEKYFLRSHIVPNQPLGHSKHANMGLNWRAMRYAKHAVIPNSAFYILPRILKHHEDPTAVTIAPRYWARRNTQVWCRPACYYPEFTYI